jgi:hypothetical protein
MKAIAICSLGDVKPSRPNAEAGARLGAANAAAARPVRWRKWRRERTPVWFEACRNWFFIER